jgi:apolipoprotein N-acyltransferase
VVSDSSRRIPDWLLVLSAGILTAAAFPPLPLGFLAYFSLVPLIVVFLRDDFQLGFEKGYIFGLVLNLGIMYWLAVNSGTDWYWATLSMIAAVLFLALNYGLIGLIFGFIGRRFGRNIGLWTLPIVWVAIEYIRSFGKLGFTWNNLCYTQTQATQLIQFVSLTGANGVSFLIVLINVMVIQAWLHRKKMPATSGRLIIGIMLIFLTLEIAGALVLQSAKSPADKRNVHVALIQPNVDPNDKWDLNSYRNIMQLLHDLTDSAAVEPRDLIVWPETATPTYLRRNQRYSLTKILSHIRRLNVHLLTGVPDFEFRSADDYSVYNSTFLLRPDSPKIEHYRKMKLVPFGEYIPLAGIFPGLNNLNLGQGLFEPGKQPTVFSIPLRVETTAKEDTILNFSSVICYESSFPYIVREGIRGGAELLVIVSNDAWYGNNSAPYLHMEISRLRAIENRVPVVRSANTGVSIICDAYGRVIARANFDQKDWLSAELAQGDRKTFFSRFGNWFGVVNVIGLFCILGYSMIRRK